MGWDLATTTTVPLRTALSPSGDGEGGTLQKSFDSMTRLKYNYPGQRQISKKYCTLTNVLHSVYDCTSLLFGRVDVSVSLFCRILCLMFTRYLSVLLPVSRFTIIVPLNASLVKYLFITSLSLIQPHLLLSNSHLLNLDACC